MTERKMLLVVSTAAAPEDLKTNDETHFNENKSVNLDVQYVAEDRDDARKYMERKHIEKCSTIVGVYET